LNKLNIDFQQAYLSIINASTEQDTKEIPLLLKSTDFKNKKCLEISAGLLARIAITLLKSQSLPDHTICLDS